MYDKDGPSGVGAEMWTMNMLQYIISKYPTTNVFWKYTEENWWHKTHMWVVGFWNLPYDGQDTNVAIESYHGTLKAQLKLEKNRLVSLHVDWHPWVSWRCPHSILIPKSTQELWVCEQQMPTIVCGWGLVGGTIDSWHKCDITFLWWWFSTCHVIKKDPSMIHHPQPNIRTDTYNYVNA